MRWWCAVWVAWMFCRTAAACEGLVVEDAWIREGPPGATVLAGFGTFRNQGTVALRITGIESTHFMHVMLHETVYRKGEAKMRARDEIALAPGAHVTLAPGGLHLMLMHGNARFAAGQSLPLDIVCGRTRATHPFLVRRDAP